MTEQEFKQRSFKNNMQYNYKNPRTGGIIECLLQAVDFDKGVLQLWPIPSQNHEIYDKTEFWVRFEYCHLPKHKLKAI